MDTNKMRDLSREQFEAWFESSGMEKFKETTWASWQASRAAVVVELPEAHMNGSYTDPQVLYAEEVRHAIEAQGLKVAS
ncbi:hypothetical protein [Pseudomonas juntendi]|uniref:hypothetical protein n=1 Tax=Pseudomonas juntendi TaxID=2666183 RepID=UPI0021B492FE|nr:hypothetical protein [Pseudomonas juntendi]UXA36835.1 hypothetical protein KZA81_15045 [Pseudomonas juntendi]